ncbi:MAG: hypothetical protein ACLURP_15910 [Ruminococcus sp.]
MSFSGMVKEELFQAYRLRKTLQDCGTGCNLYFLRQPGGWN